MMRILLAYLFLINQAYAGTQSIVKADILEGIDSVKNYAGQYSHFEKNANGWSRYDDAAATPVDCTGGSLDNTFARSTSSPLSGDASGLWTKTAANRIGEGLALPFTIDAKDKGAVLKVQFDYEVSANYADNDVRVWVYDVTNSRLIEPSPNYVKDTLVASSIQPFEFQTSIDSTSYRLCVHQASASALDYTVKIDNVKIGKSAASTGPFISDWQTYSLTIGATTTPPTKGTMAVDTAAWRRVGDTMEIKYQYRATTAGSAGSGTYLFPLPSGYSLDTSKFTQDNTASTAVVGPASMRSSSGDISSGSVLIYNATNLWIAHQGITSNALVSNVSTPFGSTSLVTLGGTNVAFSFIAKVPIVGWSSNQKLSSDASLTNVYAAGAGNPNSTLTASFSKMTWASSPVASYKDTVAGWDSANNRYLIKDAATYRACLTSESNAVTWAAGNGTSHQIRFYNSAGSVLWSPAAYNFKDSATSTVISNLSCTEFPMTAGGYIEFWALNQGTTPSWSASITGTNFTISKIDDGQQIAASETVAALYRGSPPTGTLNNSVNIITYGTRDNDSHNAYSGGSYTVPVSGRYSITAAYGSSATWSAGGVSAIYIYVDGVQVALGATPAWSAIVISVYPSVRIESIQLRAGQVVTVRSLTTGTTPTYNSDATANYFSITRTGNY